MVWRCTGRCHWCDEGSRSGDGRPAQLRPELPQEGRGVSRLRRGQLGRRPEHPCGGRRDPRGISAKDAIVTALTGSTSKAKDHAAAGKELKQALGQRAEAATAEKALRELLSAKADVEYGVGLVTRTKSETLGRRARSLVELAVQVVRLGR